MAMRIPEELKYSSDHEWAAVSNTRVRVGITDYAQDALGDVVYVDLPKVGTTVNAADPIGEVESTKSVSEIYAPVSGTIVAVNDALGDSPEAINSDPYGSGWLYDVMMSYEETLEQLLTADEYRDLVGD